MRALITILFVAGWLSAGRAFFSLKDWGKK